MLSTEIAKMEKENEKLKERVRYLEALTRENPTDKPYHCRECIHFQQYYIQHPGGGFHPIYDGSCSAGRKTKRMVAEGETCNYFEQAQYTERRCF